MSVTGEIKNLYSNKDKTKILLPRTKTKAVSDENGTSLDVLLDSKAPAGYGLGESASTVIDSYYHLNNYKQNGTYHFSYPDGALWGGVWFKEASVEVVSSGDNCITQILRPIGTAIKLVRVWDGNAWGEKEVENPPMVPGVEYRTTERWNGKAVWTVTINVGTTAEGAISTTTDFTASEIIRFGGNIGSYANPQIYDSLSHAYTTWANVQSYNGKINITVWARNGTVNLPAVIQVWYTKD